MTEDRYDWSEEPTAQDVIDALRVAARAQEDDARLGRFLRELLDWAPETDSLRGMDLVMRMISEGVLRVEMK